MTTQIVRKTLINILVWRTRLTAVTGAVTSPRPRGSRPCRQFWPRARTKRGASLPRPGRGAVAVFILGGLLWEWAAQASSIVAASAGPPAASGFSVGSPGLVLLAQAAAEPPIEPVLQFLGKIMMLVGVVMVFYGGWKIHRGETEDGILAIIGGFIVAMAIPIMKYFFSLA